MFGQNTTKLKILKLSRDFRYLQKLALNFIVLPLKRWFEFNSRIAKTHFAIIPTMNILQMITETQVTFSDDVVAAVDVVFASTPYKFFFLDMTPGSPRSKGISLRNCCQQKLLTREKLIILNYKAFLGSKGKS